MKENRKLLKDVLDDIRQDMSDEHQSMRKPVENREVGFNSAKRIRQGQRSKND